jgi:cytochrome c556
MRFTTTRLIAGALALTMATIATLATMALAQSGAVAERQENRKQAGAAMRAIKAIADAKGQTSAAVAQAAKLKQLEAAFVTQFPTDWSERAGFLAASANAAASYDRLAIAAGSGDAGQLAAAWADTVRACTACHERYRARPQ